MKNAKMTPCDETLYPPLFGLKFYQTDGGLIYFFPPENGANARDFLSKFDYLVGALCETADIPPEELTVADDAGKVYLDESLVVLWLLYAHRWFGAWVFLRIEEVLRMGFTVGNDLLKHLYDTRFDTTNPSDPPK